MISWITETTVEPSLEVQMAVLTSTTTIIRDSLPVWPQLEFSPCITITVITSPSLTSLFFPLKPSLLELLLNTTLSTDLEEELLDQDSLIDSRLVEIHQQPVILPDSCLMLMMDVLVSKTFSYSISTTNLSLLRVHGDLSQPSLAHTLLDKQRLKTLDLMATGVMLQTLVSSTTITTDPCSSKDGDPSSVYQLVTTNGKELINLTHQVMSPTKKWC